MQVPSYKCCATSADNKLTIISGSIRGVSEWVELECEFRYSNSKTPVYLMTKIFSIMIVLYVLEVSFSNLGSTGHLLKMFASQWNAVNWNLVTFFTPTWVTNVAMTIA